MRYSQKCPWQANAPSKLDRFNTSKVNFGIFAAIRKQDFHKWNYVETGFHNSITAWRTIIGFLGKLTSKSQNLFDKPDWFSSETWFTNLKIFTYEMCKMTGICALTCRVKMLVMYRYDLLYGDDCVFFTNEWAEIKVKKGDGAERWISRVCTKKWPMPR